MRCLFSLSLSIIVFGSSCFWECFRYLIGVISSEFLLQVFAEFLMTKFHVITLFCASVLYLPMCHYYMIHYKPKN